MSPRPTDAAASIARPAPAEVRSASSDTDDLIRRALDVGRRTALGVLAGDGAAADDVAQDAAILALRHAERLRDPAALDAWLRRTAVRAALRTVRGRRRRRAHEEHHAAVSAARPGTAGEPPAGTGSGIDELAGPLRTLPPRQRAALTLRYVHDLDDDEIATALGCRAGTVRALLSRGRAALRAELDPGRHPEAHRPGDDHARR